MRPASCSFCSAYGHNTFNVYCRAVESVAASTPKEEELSRDERELIGVIVDKDIQLADKDSQLAAHESLIADKDSQLAAHESLIADKDSLIAKLRADIAKLIPQPT